MPALFDFGDSLSSTKERLTKHCDKVDVIDVYPITAPLAKHSQRQINCHGFNYAGKPRNVELVFQDDQLDLVWILINDDEKTSI